MKNSIVFIILILIIFASHVMGKEPITPIQRFGGDHLVNPGKIIASDGEVFVIEPQMYRIVIFSGAGEFKMNLGRAGEGPGEFKKLQIVNIANNMIYCYDTMGRRIHLFSKENKSYLRFIPLTDTLYGHLPTQMAIHPDGTIIMFNNGLSKEHTLIGLYTPEGKLIKRFFNAFPAYEGDSEFLEDIKKNGHSNNAFYKNVGYIGVSEGKIYYANIVENQVVEMDMDGKILNRFSFPLPSHEDTIKTHVIKGNEGKFSFDENRLTYDLKATNDSIYILCRDNGISYIFRLEKGAFQEVCRMKETLSRFDIMDNKIFCLEAGSDDEEKNPEVLVYNLPVN